MNFVMQNPLLLIMRHFIGINLVNNSVHHVSNFCLQIFNVFIFLFYLFGEWGGHG